MEDLELKEICLNLNNSENFDPQLQAYTSAIPTASTRQPLRDITPKPKIKKTAFLLTNAALKGPLSAACRLR